MNAPTMNAPAASAPVVTVPPGEVDSRAAYTVFALAYVVGHGLAALSKGTEPLLDLPGWLPATLFGAGVVPALTLAVRAGVRAQKGASESRRNAEKLLGAAWCTGFTALFLAITGLARATGMSELQNVLWPAGSVLIVGLISIAEGTARRNALHYTLGSWLATVAGTALFFAPAGLYATLAIAAGGGYAVAAVLERRRITALSATHANLTQRTADPVPTLN
ncbi:ABC transporter permease [Plantactinospora sp. BB1]|uniref:ABC transporter permease n=1 Tax=Plantactinospora sp. BB1 TaxID=2071627 RepID=UPI000D168BE4|nr:ABC transporter permease [Plantactinospora sp. BB1]AVT37695.1 ABC transporter permease [Plantactinospora sp. BB1]